MALRPTLTDGLPTGFLRSEVYNTLAPYVYVRVRFAINTICAAVEFVMSVAHDPARSLMYVRFGHAHSSQAPQTINTNCEKVCGLAELERPVGFCCATHHSIASYRTDHPLGL